MHFPFLRYATYGQRGLPCPRGEKDIVVVFQPELIISDTGAVPYSTREGRVDDDSVGDGDEEDIIIAAHNGDSDGDGDANGGDDGG